MDDLTEDRRRGGLGGGEGDEELLAYVERSGRHEPDAAAGEVGEPDVERLVLPPLAGQLDGAACPDGDAGEDAAVLVGAVPRLAAEGRDGVGDAFEGELDPCGTASARAGRRRIGAAPSSASAMSSRS